MIDVLGLCRTVRSQFPNPAKSSLIYQAVLDVVGYEPPSDVQHALVKTLSAHWKRNGWTWSDTGAAQLNDDEDVLFHDNGLTFIKSGGDVPADKVRLIPVGYNDTHPRVIWFK